MCLLSNRSEANVAKKDITCYKLVHSETFQSPFYYKKYRVGGSYTEPTFEAKKNKGAFDRDVRIEFGFHTYKTIQTTRCHGDFRFAILKCVIPAGTRYWEDAYDETYCSETIKVVAWKPFWGGKWGV